MERAAFKAFYQRTSRALWVYLFRLTGDSELSSDIQQETYLRFLQKPWAGHHEAQMKTYLYTIATRLNIDRWKRRRIDERWRQSLPQRQNGSTDGLDERIGLLTDMEQAFQELKTQERALLWLAYVEEQSHRSIAKILGLREKSVRVSLFRARKRLSRILERKG